MPYADPNYAGNAHQYLLAVKTGMTTPRCARWHPEYEKYVSGFERQLVKIYWTKVPARVGNAFELKSDYIRIKSRFVRCNTCHFEL